jgi:hypothetical protein
MAVPRQRRLDKQFQVCDLDADTISSWGLRPYEPDALGSCRLHLIGAFAFYFAVKGNCLSQNVANRWFRKLLHLQNAKRSDVTYLVTIFLDFTLSHLC